MRVIVCGSRDFQDQDYVWRALSDLYGTECEWGTGHEFTVVHGNCPTGADHFAELWCKRNGVEPVHFDADWTLYGPSAGPRRNKQMADAGADLCLGFWDGRNRNGKEPGTLGMIRLALGAGIQVRIVPPRRKA